MIKRIIVELMAHSKEDGEVFEPNTKRPIPRFRDSEKVSGIPNEGFPLIITATIANFDMSRILINGQSSCNIMYKELYEKL